MGDFELLSIKGLEGDSRRETQMKKAVEERDRADREARGARPHPTLHLNLPTLRVTTCVVA